MHDAGHGLNAKIYSNISLEFGHRDDIRFLEVPAPRSTPGVPLVSVSPGCRSPRDRQARPTGRF